MTVLCTEFVIDFYVFGLQDEPLPIANAHALHGLPPPSVESLAAPAQAIQPPASAASHVKDDILSRAESKVDEDKLQVIIK